MENLVMYAVGAVFVSLLLIPIGTMLAFVPMSALGAVGKGLFGRGGSDDDEARKLLHPYAPADKSGFYNEDDLNRPFPEQNQKAA